MKARQVAMQALVRTRQRAIYASLKASSKIGKKIIVPSYLRIEEELKDSQNVYTFDVLKTGNETAVERKLDQNDIFVCSHLGLYIYEQLLLK